MKEINIIVEGGKAQGSSLGPTLGPLGINTGKVAEEINKKTKSFQGIKVPVKILVDSSTKEFQIEVGTPPVSELLKKKLNLEKGSGKAWKEETAGDIGLEEVVEIAKSVKENMLSKDLRNATKEVLGTALSIGIKINGKNPKEVIKEIDEGKHEMLFKE